MDYENEKSNMFSSNSSNHIWKQHVGICGRLFELTRIM